MNKSQVFVKNIYLDAAFSAAAVALGFILLSLMFAHGRVNIAACIGCVIATFGYGIFRRSRVMQTR